MTQQLLNVGGAANDGTGDPIRTGAGKINDNFTELYGAYPALKTVTPSGSTAAVDLSGASMVTFNAAAAATVHSFTNVIPGRLYYFFFANGNTTIDRNGAYLIGGANVNFASGSGALFVGLSSTVIRQVTAATTAT